MPKLGDALPSFEISNVTKERVDDYLALSRDGNPIHSDIAIAEAAGFDQLVVPGALIMAEAAKSVEAWRHCGGIKDLDARFLNPVLVGRNLQIHGSVRHVDFSGSTAILRVRITQSDKLAMVAEITVTLRP